MEAGFRILRGLGRFRIWVLGFRVQFRLRLRGRDAGLGL